MWFYVIRKDVAEILPKNQRTKISACVLRHCDFGGQQASVVSYHTSGAVACRARLGKKLALDVLRLAAISILSLKEEVRAAATVHSRRN